MNLGCATEVAIAKVYFTGFTAGSACIGGAVELDGYESVVVEFGWYLRSFQCKSNRQAALVHKHVNSFEPRSNRNSFRICIIVFAVIQVGEGFEVQKHPLSQSAVRNKLTNAVRVVELRACKIVVAIVSDDGISPHRADHVLDSHGVGQKDRHATRLELRRRKIEIQAG